MGEYDAAGVETALNIVGPDGWRERVVPDWVPASGPGSTPFAYYGNGTYNYGVNVTDDWFAYDPQGSAVERVRQDATQACFNPDPDKNNDANPVYIYDEVAYDAWGNRLMDDSPYSYGAPATILGSDAAGYEAQYGYQTDTGTGLILAGHRYYQPQTRS